MEQLKFRMLQPILSQRKSTDLSNKRIKQDSLQSINIVNSPKPFSNISYRKNHKHKALSQGVYNISMQTFYGSPLLGQNQLEAIDKMKSQQRNDFYGQLKSCDPYQYPTRLQELQLSPKSPREPTVEVIIPSELKEPPITLGRLSDNLSRHNARDKLHRGIPQKHDIKQLASWVDLMVLQIIDKYGDQRHIEFYEEVQNVLTLCLKELIRQISIDCIERSVLLEKIWAQYVEINSSVIKQALDEKREIEKSNLKQIMKTHQLYQVEIDNFQLIIKHLKDDQQQLTERLIKLKDNGKYLKKTNKHLQNITRELRFQLNDVTTTNKYLLSEVENLKQYIEEAEKDMQNYQQQFKNHLIQQRIESPTSPRKKPINRAGTVFLSSRPQEQLKIIRAGKHKTLFHEPKPEEKVQKALKSDTDSSIASDIENMLKDQSTDTDDLYCLMEIQKEQSTQAYAQVPQFNYKALLLPDTRHQIIQTDSSLYNIAFKETQTELQTEMVEVIKTEEEQLMQIQEHLMKVSANYQSIQGESSNDESPRSRRISQFFQSLGEASSKMKQTVQMQREIRTSLLLVNSAQKDENNRKQDQIIALKSINDGLSKNVDEATLEIQELEAQLDLQEKINTRLEKRYNKVKERKQQILEKTQNLVNSFTKTQKFTNIMKKKILEKKAGSPNGRKISSPSQIQIQSQNDLQSQQQQNQNQNHLSLQQINVKQLANLQNQKNISQEQVQNTSLPNQQLESSKIVVSAVSNQMVSQSQEGASMKKKWNIHITNADEQKQMSDNESDFSQSQLSVQRSTYSAQDDFQDSISQRSLATNKSGISQVKTSNKPTSNYQLVPNSNHQISKQSKAKKDKNLNQTSQNHIPLESIRLIQDTLRQFINEELDNSDTSSVDSSFSTKLEDLNKRKLEGSQRRKNVTLAQAPKFQNRNNAESTSSLNFQKSQNLVSQLSDKFSRNPKSSNAKMQKINVLKFISQFYCEKIRQFSNKNMPLHQICYEHFVNTYGFKSMAEQKLTNFYQSVFAYRENFRINLFGRFAELFSPLTLDDLEIYIQSLKTLDENEMPIQLAQVVNEKGVLISLDRALACLDAQHSCLPFESKDRIMKEIKTHTYERKNKICVDLDFFISKVLTGYHQLKMMHQAHFEEVFYSADMDMDGMIEFQEFQKLFLHFEINQGTNLNQKIIRSQFMERCDTVSNESGEKAMSFDRFVTFSLENNIFSEEKFQRFSRNVDQNDPIKNLNDLKENWLNIQALLNNRIDLSESGEAQYYQSIIQKLDLALNNKELKESYWISYRILDADTKAVYLSKVVAGYLPSEFLCIQELMNEIFDENIQYISD
ncbi:unnamed protein product (macronuclear) [Paramecium tetraurelia]|uniref:EF-hand domain-containing protein n=1 Tax=Paramecium tetraurelia TaxID=5888 RepID=A0BC59_PARTE|nr:uncharacterized protein GSPATT00000562001 [Paramecium tetraurelia]CAK56126.1 unnamed protein product [Paramecium tetraurelia]|eukprot:XP_001423524.1 hypothetical protein (macronuclear) [Paramecium tetraurelia strain d4-2]